MSPTYFTKESGIKLIKSVTVICFITSIFIVIAFTGGAGKKPIDKWENPKPTTTTNGLSPVFSALDIPKIETRSSKRITISFASQSGKLKDDIQVKNARVLSVAPNEDPIALYLDEKNRLCVAFINEKKNLEIYRTDSEMEKWKEVPIPSLQNKK